MLAIPRYAPYISPKLILFVHTVAKPVKPRMPSSTNTENNTNKYEPLGGNIKSGN